KPFDLSQHERLPPTLGKLFKRCLETAQFLPADDGLIGAWLVDDHAQGFEVGNSFDGNDLSATTSIDNGMTRHGEQKCSRRFRVLASRCLVNFDIDVLAQIPDVVL